MIVLNKGGVLRRKDIDPTSVLVPGRHKDRFSPSSGSVDPPSWSDSVRPFRDRRPFIGTPVLVVKITLLLVRVFLGMTGGEVEPVVTSYLLLPTLTKNQNKKKHTHHLLFTQ